MVLDTTVVPPVLLLTATRAMAWLFSTFTPPLFEVIDTAASISAFWSDTPGRVGRQGEQTGDLVTQARRRAVSQDNGVRGT